MRISSTATRRIFAAGVVVQMGIVVTGGLVRLTGSGLGCPDWPDCVAGSITPVVNQPQGYHKGIEFGNRLLTVSWWPSCRLHRGGLAAAAETAPAGSAGGSGVLGGLRRRRCSAA